MVSSSSLLTNLRPFLSERKREVGEIIPQSATQSDVVKRVGFDPEYSIDGLYNTAAEPLPEGHTGAWLKVNLDMVYCVKSVAWYKSDGDKRYDWNTCSVRGCQLNPKIHSVAHFALTVHGDAGVPRVAHCKAGSSLLFEQDSNTTKFTVSELSIIAMLGEFYFFSIITGGNQVQSKVEFELNKHKFWMFLF